MRQTTGFLILGALVALVLCAALVCLAGGTVAWRAWQRPSNLADVLSEIELQEEPTPPLRLTVDPPDPLDEETALTALSLEHPTRDLIALAERLGRVQEPIPRVVRPVALERQVGDQDLFWVHDEEAGRYFTATATLAYVADHSYWWVQDGYQVSAPALQRSAERFETRTYPTTRFYFGTEWSPGIDGDLRVHIFNGSVPGVGGCFSPVDEHSVLVNPYSNEREMFYINLGNAMPGTEYYDGILAHELQHMIHWYTDRDEDTWVNEGMSELAAQLSGYDVGGSDLLFSLEPDTQLTTWPDSRFSGPHYGASYLFAAYFLQRFGEEMLRAVVAHPGNGIQAFDQVLAASGHTERIDDLLADWVVANYLDSDAHGAGRYEYRELQLGEMRPAAVHGSYPVHQQSTVHQYAADYVVLEPPAGADALEIRFAGATKVSLVGIPPASGRYHWWSGRGDDRTATLTRAFDLTGLTAATLRFSLWHEIEPGYDYAYVEASADGGAHWDILRATHTTSRNPNAASFGPGYTGNSGTGARGSWIPAQVDLTPYVGREVLIRFEMVTDEAVNLAGTCLDDIEIPELGYIDDVESGEGGWEAWGWGRVGADVPQRFAVQVITFGLQPSVRQLPLAADQTGSLVINDLSTQLDRAVLVIAALAPVTTEGASYQYWVIGR